MNIIRCLGLGHYLIRLKPNRSNVNKKTIFLISRGRFTYKFVIPDIKRKQNIF